MYPLKGNLQDLSQKRGVEVDVKGGGDVMEGASRRESRACRPVFVWVLLLLSGRMICGKKGSAAIAVFMSMSVSAQVSVLTKGRGRVGGGRVVSYEWRHEKERGKGSPRSSPAPIWIFDFGRRIRDGSRPSELRAPRSPSPPPAAPRPIRSGRNYPQQYWRMMSLPSPLSYCRFSHHPLVASAILTVPTGKRE